MVTDEAELADAWIRGDNDAGRALVQKHGDGVYRFFRNRLPPKNLDAAVQETWKRCIEKMPTFERRSSFRTFLFGIARFVLLEQWRELSNDRQRNVPLPSRSVNDLSDAPATDGMEHARQEYLLVVALRLLPFEQQVALELAIIEEMSVEEIAQTLSQNPNTVNGRLQKAKAKLKRIIRELTDDRELAESTIKNLEGWAGAVRERWNRERSAAAVEPTIALP